VASGNPESAAVGPAIAPSRGKRDGALNLAAGYADELGCADQLTALLALLQRGGGAGRQRGIHAIAGMDTLLRELTERTASA
jgi:hypothetical protein